MHHRLQLFKIFRMLFVDSIQKYYLSRVAMLPACQTWFGLLVTLAGVACNSGVVSDETEVWAHLEDTLPKLTPPYDMINNTVYIYADLFQILDIDEKNGACTVKLWIYYSYESPSVQWQTKSFSNIYLVLPARNAFWMPDIGIETFSAH